MRTQARNLRKRTTPAENVLWGLLRRRGVGVRFRRQHPIGPYIVDFFAASARLVVEVDGQHHYEGEYDERRDAYLNARDLRVLHLENQVVFNQPGDVLAEVRLLIADPLATPTRDYE